MVTAIRVGSGSSNGVPSACFLSFKSESRAAPSTSVIFGITSPLLTTLTRSPSMIPSLSTSPLLCNVVLSTVTPETVTGATLETGVTFPVLPVCHSTSISTLIASSGGNFQARAHLGWCAVIPSNVLLLSRSSLITMPSISQSAPSLFSVHLFTTVIISAVVD